MIDVFELYNRVLAAVNSWQAGFLKIEDFKKWVDEESVSLFNIYCAEWEKSRVIDNKLAMPFLREINIILAPNFGKPFDFAPFPANFGYLDNLYLLMKPENEKFCGCSGKDIVNGKDMSPLSVEQACELLDEDDMERLKYEQGIELVEYFFNKIASDRWGDRLKDPNRIPSFEEPIMTIDEGGFKIAPKNTGVVILRYLEKPAPCVINYTQVNDGPIVYGAPTTIQWNHSVVDILVRMIAKRFATATGNVELYQMMDKELEKLLP